MTPLGPMLDILKGLASGTLLLSWIVPAAVAVGLIALLDYPVVAGLPFTAPVSHLDPVTIGGILGVSAIALGVTMSAGSTLLYRVLEGYVPPLSWLGTRLSARMREVRSQLEQTAQSSAPNSAEQRLAYERLARFPSGSDPVLSTRLGNAMLAIESYGWNRWGLDSQGFWTELLHVTSDTIRDQMDSARSGVDFWVSVYFNLCIIALASVTVLLLRFSLAATLSWQALACLLAAVVLLPVVYRAAVLATTSLGNAVQALVDTGRKPLAEAWGLSLPSTTELERSMWTVLATFTFYPYSSAAGEALDDFRSASHATEVAPQQPGKSWRFWQSWH